MDNEIVDIKSQVGRLRERAFYCGYTDGCADASVFMHLPEFMKNMSLVAINKIVQELTVVAYTGELDTSQKYMYWFLESSGVIRALREVDSQEEESL